MVMMQHLDDKKKMYKKIQRLEDAAIKTSKNLVLNEKKAYKDESDEKQAYSSYVYSLLSSKRDSLKQLY